MEVALDGNPEAQSKFQVPLTDSQLGAPGPEPRWMLPRRTNKRMGETPLWEKLTHGLTDWYQNTLN